MKTFRHILSYLQAALLIGLTAACHDDIQSPNNSPDVDFATGITLRIPNLSRAADFARTRAEDPIPGANIIENEGKIHDNDLHLYIFPTDQNGSKIHVQLGNNTTFYQELPCLDKDGNKTYAGIITSESNTETSYHIPMIPGKYKLYVLGNLKEYNENLVLNDNLTEDDIKGITLKFDGPLEAGHLPMLCLPEDVDGTTNGEFDVLNTNLTELACNLSFQCAKVRYTVLFDNTADPKGHSFDQFGANHFLDFDGATVSNIASGINLDTTKEYSENPLSDSEEITLTRSEWPEGETFEKYNAVGTNYPGTGTNDKGVATPGLKAHNGNWTDNDRRRAWQGIVYLPENKKTDARTTLHLAGLVDGTSDNPYEVKLIEGAKGDKTSTLDRGKFYDLTLLATSLQTTELKFVIQDFTTQQLIYDLHGPYFLHIKENPVNIVPGERYAMWYDTNAPELEGYSPLVTLDNGKQVPLYKFEEDKDNNTFNIWINPEVKSKYFDGIKAEKEKYNFFHIKAGNLYKRIEVYPFDLDLFLLVDPDDITINVREKIASGDYGDKYIITIQTNYDSYTITQDNWKSLFNDDTETNTSTDLYLTKPDGTRVKFGDKITPSETGVDTYYLYYTGLNDGRTFWTEESHKLALIVTATTEDGSKTSDPEKVNIQTYPSSDNYIIHVKLPAEWTSPHIYVYQCLEFPATTNDAKRANKPLATSSDGRTAALEYSFTGKIAFKGWNVGAYNDPNAAAGQTTNGFWYFTGDTSWEPADVDPKHYYELDFCHSFRENADCADCKNEKYNKTWPGIRMEWEKDNNDGKWWKFILSGVATPGKSLIMFADQHTRGEGTALGNDWNSRRYPEIKKVGDEEMPDPGIPLFDYPNREGWIDLTSDAGKQNGFTPNDPNNNQGGGVIEVPNTYRLYFTWNAHGSLSGLNLWDGSGFVVGDGSFNYNNSSVQKAKNGTELGDAYYHKAENGWAYLEWQINSMPSGSINMAPPSSGDVWTTFTSSSFRQVGNVWCAYSDSGDANKVKPGLPY